MSRERPVPVYLYEVPLGDQSTLAYLIDTSPRRKGYDSDECSLVRRLANSLKGVKGPYDLCLFSLPSSGIESDAVPLTPEKREKVCKELARELGGHEL